MFSVNSDLINQARSVFQERPEIYWIVGGSCAGKSTISQALVAGYGLEMYDMDVYIYDRYMPRYDAQRHPANTAWLAAPNPLAWQLALSPAKFEAFNRATTAEYLDLLAADLASLTAGPLLIDGGITHPELLLQLLPAGQLCCLSADDAQRQAAWENDPGRAMMKEWVSALPSPEAMWARFLAFDRQMNETMVAQSQAGQVPVFWRGEYSVEALAARVAAHFGYTTGRVS